MTLGLPWHLFPAVGERLALETAAALVGTLVAIVVLRFFLALIFRAGTLTAPTCRHCRGGLRGEGDAVPHRCPECGKNLDPAVDVRWMVHARPMWGRIAVWAFALFLGVTLGGVVAVQLAEDWIRTSPRSASASSDLVLERMLAFPSISPRFPERFALLPQLRVRRAEPLTPGESSHLGSQGGVLSVDVYLEVARGRSEAIEEARATGRAVDLRDQEWATWLALIAVHETEDPASDERAIEILRRARTPVLVTTCRVARGNEALLFHDALALARDGPSIREEISSCRLDGTGEPLVVRRLTDRQSRIEIPASTSVGPHMMEIAWRSILKSAGAESVVLSEHVERVPVEVLAEHEEMAAIAPSLAANPLDGAIAMVELNVERPRMWVMGTGVPRLLVLVELLLPRRPFAARLPAIGVWSLVVDGKEFPFTVGSGGNPANLVAGPSLGWSDGLPTPSPRQIDAGAGDRLLWGVALPLRTEEERRIAALLQAGQGAVRFSAASDAAEWSEAGRWGLPTITGAHDVAITLRARSEVRPGSPIVSVPLDAEWPLSPPSDVAPSRYASIVSWLFPF